VAAARLEIAAAANPTWEDPMAQRQKLKKSQFGLPGKRKYPVPDKEHAANAKGRAKQQLKKGKLSRSAYEKIVAKANKVLKAAKTKKAAKSKKGAKK
jgi:hypothetical protein